MACIGTYCRTISSPVLSGHRACRLMAEKASEVKEDLPLHVEGDREPMKGLEEGQTPTGHCHL